MGKLGGNVELADMVQQLFIRQDGAVGFHFHEVFRKQPEQPGKGLLLNKRLASGDDQAAARIMEDGRRRLFRGKLHSRGCAVP